MEAEIQEQLAKAIGVTAASLTLVNKEALEWRDGSLGCPQPGMMYTQALVPGYRLVFDDGTRTYEIHTGRSGTPAIWCDHGRPKRLG